MAKARVLTQAFLDAIRPTDKREEYPDLKQPGLRLIVQTSDARSWALRYRFGGRSAKLTLGGYPSLGLATARNKAAKAAASLADDVDPGALKKAAKAVSEPKLDLIENVVESFIKRYAQRQTRENTWRETERLLTREVVSQWRGRSIAAIRRRDVVSLLDPIADRAPIVANRTFSALRKMFGWAVERGLIETSPCVGVRPPSKETSRERTLDDAEIAALWQATAEIAYPFGPLVRMLLLTGARLREAGEARWPEVDLEAKTWTIPRERSKNDVASEVPLSPQMLAILESLPHFEGCDFIFTIDARRPIGGFHRGKRRLDALMAPATPFTLHDLRRTCASGMAGLGIAPHIVEAVLNHKSGTIKGVAAVYNRYSYATEKRAALERWADHIERLVTGAEASNVVELAAARR